MVGGLDTVAETGSRSSRNDATPSCRPRGPRRKWRGCPAVCRHRMVGAKHPPHHVPGQRDRYRRGVVGAPRMPARSAAGSNSSALAQLPHPKPPVSASRASKTAARTAPFERPADTHQPCRNQLEQASGDHRRAAPTEAEARIVRRQADVHRQQHLSRRCRTAAPFDRGDHRLQAVEDSQRDSAAAVAHRLVAPVDLTVGSQRAWLGARGLVVAGGVVEGLRAGRQVGTGAERAAGAADDDRAHFVVSVGCVEAAISSAIICALKTCSSLSGSGPARRRTWSRVSINTWPGMGALRERAEVAMTL